MTTSPSQSCPECGTRAEPGQAFCDSCGTVLSWTDQAGAARATAGGAAEETARAGAPGADDASGGAAAPARTQGRPGQDTGRGPSEDPIPGTAAQGGNEPDSTIRMRAVSPPEADGADGADGTADRARPLVVPVADPSAAAAPPPPVSPVLPGRPAAARHQVAGVGPASGDFDGPPCPWCGTANRPDRHFCVRCAMPMAGEQQPRGGPRPWWRRLLGARSRETPWAGERPRLRRSFEHLLRWLFAAVVLTLLVFLAVQLPDGVQATRDHFAKRAPVEPDGYRALHSFEGHPARLAFDKANDTWWGPGVNQSGEGEWIEARFEQPTRLLDVLITSGISAQSSDLRKSALPHRVEVRITTADGQTTTRELVLDQKLGPQRKAFRAQEVIRVRFTIRSAYGAAPDKQVSIAEIEFFGVSSSSIL